MTKDRLAENDMVSFTSGTLAGLASTFAACLVLVIALYAVCASGPIPFKRRRKH